MPTWIAAAAGGVSLVIGLVLLGLWWHSRTPHAVEGYLPRLAGNLDTTHLVDGSTITWDVRMVGDAEAVLSPSGKHVPLVTTSAGAPFVLKLSPADSQGLDKYDLVLA